MLFCSYHKVLTSVSLITIASSVQSLGRVRLFATPWISARQASLSITNSRSSLRFMSIESVMPSSHLILCHPLLLLSRIPSSIKVFSSESTLHMRWPKYWSFSFSIIPSKEILGLISFRMGWLDLLAVQGTLKSLLQHHSSKASKAYHYPAIQKPKGGGKADDREREGENKKAIMIIWAFIPKHNHCWHICFIWSHTYLHKRNY